MHGGYFGVLVEKRNKKVTTYVCGTSHETKKIDGMETKKKNAMRVLVPVQKPFCLYTAGCSGTSRRWNTSTHGSRASVVAIQMQDRDSARMWCTLVRTDKSIYVVRAARRCTRFLLRGGGMLLEPETKLQHCRRLSFPHIGE